MKASLFILLHCFLINGLYSQTYQLIAANPSLGFNFPYVLYTPANLDKEQGTWMLVETNNTGLHDNFSVHVEGSIDAITKNSIGNYVSNLTGYPFLMPVFPRSETDWKIYTHALDRDALISEDSLIRRLDLQLISMIEDARGKLANQNIEIAEKVFMIGFSASGTFANRFSIIHPERLQAVVAGGINSIPILPVYGVGEEELIYPIGIADVAAITGKTVQLDAFRVLPKLLFMGEHDDNDAVAFDDAYSEEERRLVYDYIGEKMPDRWVQAARMYSDAQVEAEFKTYSGIGHATDHRINKEVVAFILRNSVK